MKPDDTQKILKELGLIKTLLIGLIGLSFLGLAYLFWFYTKNPLWQANKIPNTLSTNQQLSNSNFSFSKPLKSANPSIHQSDLVQLPKLKEALSIPPLQDAIWMTTDCQIGSFIPKARISYEDYGNLENGFYYYMDSSPNSAGRIGEKIDDARYYISRLKAAVDKTNKLEGKNLAEWKQFIKNSELQLKENELNFHKKILADKAFCVHRDGSKVYIPDWLVNQRYRLKINSAGERTIEKIRVNTP